MTTTMRVILDQLVAPVPGGIGRYTEELTRELIRVAPADCEVSGVISSSPETDYNRVTEMLPGLAGLFKSALARRELALAWQHGFTRLPGRGMVHSPSLLAPLHRHDRVNNVGEQTVVTIHDVVPWTHPEMLTPRGVSWHKIMAKRAQRYADAVVVPTHAVAAELTEVLDLGERVRVIGGAVSPKLVMPIDADARAARLGLPDRFLLSVGTLEPRKGLEPLISSLADPASTDLPLLIAGPSGWGDIEVASIVARYRIDPRRVVPLGYLSDADLALTIGRATVFVFPSIAEGFGLPVLEAMSLGTPVVHSNAAAVVEVAADSGVSVPLSASGGSTMDDGYPARLASAIRSLVDDEAARTRLGFAGHDRASAYSWRDAAQRVWQLHADL